ncbi:MAG: FkbM family methyltransferase [Acidobacteriota bacterium]
MKLKILLFLLGLAIGLALGQVFFPSSEGPSSYPLGVGKKIRTELDRYAPKQYSEGNEEVVIRHFFQDRRGGYFLDVGAYHYRDKSNTYYLEKNLGWGGIAVDANGEFEQGYLKHRPQTRFFALFVSDKSDEMADFFIVKDPRHLTKSTAVRSFIEGREADQIKVPTIKLDDLLQKLEVKKIDFFNLDIELWEPHALAGFSIGQYQPDLVCIEAHPPVRAQILKYFHDNSYQRLDQYLLFDQRNWYFAPRILFPRPEGVE